jgi:hypothetical protein
MRVLNAGAQYLAWKSIEQDATPPHRRHVSVQAADAIRTLVRRLVADDASALHLHDALGLMPRSECLDRPDVPNHSDVAALRAPVCLPLCRSFVHDRLVKCMRRNGVECTHKNGTRANASTSLQPVDPSITASRAIARMSTTRCSFDRRITH